MNRKWLFSHASFLVCLMLAGFVSLLAIPEVAEAQDPPAIEWIRMYYIPESALRAVGPEATGMRPTVTGVWPPPIFTEGRYTDAGSNLWRTRDYGIVNGYVPIDSTTGAPVGGIPLTSEFGLKAGDILGIAIRVGPVNQVHWGTRLDMSWHQGGLDDQDYLNHWFYPGHLPTNYEFTEYTILFRYKVRTGDMDLDGGWFADNTPFKGAGGSTRPISRQGRSVNVDTLQFTGTIDYPPIEGIRPTVSKPTFEPEFTGWDIHWREDGHHLPSGSRWVQDANSPYAITSTPRGTEAESRYAAFYETCFYVWDNAGRPGINTDDFRQRLETAGCITAEGGIAYPAGLQPRPLGVYGADETIQFQVKFSEPVWAETELQLTFIQHGEDSTGSTQRTASLVVDSPTTHPKKSGSVVKSDADNKLTFEYVVQEGDYAYGTGGISFYFPFTAGHGKTQPKIVDGAGNPFYPHDVTNRFRNLHPPANWGGGFSHMIDTVRANVQIERPAGETDAQPNKITGAFDVDMHFWNNTSSRGLPEHVANIDTDAIAAAIGEEWRVETALLGFNYQGIEDSLLHHTFQSEVHRATFTPPLNFKGDVTIQVPENVAQDLGRNGNLESNTFTVSVNTVIQVVEDSIEFVAPAAGVYTPGESIEVKLTYDKENLRYVGQHPPYVTLYLGEQVAANERHARWVSAEPTNSTEVTYTYELQAGDPAGKVRLHPRGMSVPEGTVLLADVDDASLRLNGQSPSLQEPARDAAPTRKREASDVPFLVPSGQDESRPPVSSALEADTESVPFYPILEEPEVKAAASDVPRSPIVFNELGNGSGAENDWLEFRNVTGDAVSLKDYELSVVQDGKKEDTSLIVFPDVSVPANGLLLITHSDPTAAGNVLAGGDDVSTADVEQKGSPHRYLVNAGLSLPDDGQFLLILRKAKEKLGLDEAFVDVAGGGGSDTDAFIRETTGLYETHVWPLQVLEAPGSETAAALGSGKVWQRAKADIVGYHQDAWAEAAFTGLGYDRNVTKSAATAGTPGYPNVPVKPAAATPKGAVTFSEIMFDSAGGTLPQWIELYNTSKTEVLNLNRWELEIQNVDSEDLVGRPIVRLTLQEKLIQPNQTLLIVTGDARASSADVFPEDRVYNLLELHDKNLRIKKPQDTFLSATGFYLRLTDRNEHLVDEIGNTDGNRRTDDTPAWALPLSGSVGGTSGPDAMEGMRSSLIRRYDKGVARAGTEKASWALAANFAKFKVSELHYGHADDIGTPGYRQGGALPVELSSFTVTRVASDSVVVTWATESEVDNAGFNLRRSLTRDSGFTLLNPALIAGAGTTGERQEYTFTDTSAKPGVEYYYQIEEVSFDGKRETLAMRRLRGPVSAANRMLTTFGAVKQREE